MLRSPASPGRDGGFLPHAPSAHPTEIRRLPETREVRFLWSDGLEVEYAYSYLRGYCPCAGCQGHTPSEVRFRQPASSVEPWRIEPVGNYGISIQWSDGHATGIYRWDFLRQICPCEDCAAEDRAAEDGADHSTEHSRGEEE